MVERRTQSRDHPILLTVPETHYLKCLILRVCKGVGLCYRPAESPLLVVDFCYNSLGGRDG